MFLHSGASIHGHEYSARHSSTFQSPAHLRAPFFRSALSPPKQRIAADGTPAPALRQRPASDYIPRGPLPVDRFREPQDDPPPTPARDESISDSELSDVTTSIDNTLSTPSAGRRRPRRAQRKSTTYYLGYPTPRIIGKTKVVQKVFLPRILLQLQKASAEGRSQPVLEAFPAWRIAGPVVALRLAKRFPSIFRVKRHLGYDDIVLVSRDDGDLGSEGIDTEHEETLETRNLLAVYSPLRHSEAAEIVLDDGSVWAAKPLVNGSYDFVHTDAEGKTTTARWARRHAYAATPTSFDTDTSAYTPAHAHTRYTFSIINPLTRRHPVMATLTPSTLNVQDTYTSVSPSQPRQPPMTRIGRSQSEVSSPPLAFTAPYPPSKLSSSRFTSDGEDGSAICMPSSSVSEPSPPTVHRVDDATKVLISVTALWVALHSGWSQSYNSSRATSEIAASPSPSPSPSPVSQRGRSSRRNTWTTRPSTYDTLGSADLASGESPRSCGGLLKRYSMPAQPLDGTAIIKPANPSPAVSRPPTPTLTSTGNAEPSWSGRVASVATPLASPTAKAEPVQSRPLEREQETEQNARMSVKQTAERLAGVASMGGKKKGVRSRLVRWMQKIGSSPR
ncbi:hypothetical protein N657DRAFT_564680 [Parathielavia appendiculata]|uniref:Uncharacterized protein n=1 Tax=Parathielavia appendiculata TaxID=2587402 RepID=A0AAN6U6A9_9PEZI|nr:hypothetical protein N657DRAFT_564680 [Parathielavia appendiculata]